MDRKAAQTLIENTFNYPFDEDRFRYFAINLLTNLDKEKDSPYISGKYIKDFFREHVHKYRRIGTYIAPDGDKLDVLVVHLVNPWALERSRTMLRNFTAWYLKNQDEKDAALVAYHTDDLDDWRFSFVRMEYLQEITEKGKIKVKEEFTPARRYSYLVGKNEPNHTAQEQMIPILEDDQDNPTLDDIEAAFSVDAVTKQFYKDYRALFETLTNELNNILEKDNKIKKEFEDKSIETAHFAKKLMGQIVFLYFLQKKGWFGVERDEFGNFKNWGTGPKNFLRRLIEKEYADYQNFFNEILEPLFYEAMSTERPDDSYSKLNCKIPFLNGGLFEPINEYNWIETDICIDNEIFIEIFDTFDRYNFTVREDEPLEKEVAVDPEMLGKVFENILPENLRKGTGAYYTPRTIVHYMCQESLIQYLSSECKEDIPKEDIAAFIRSDEVGPSEEQSKGNGDLQQLSQSIAKNANLLDKKLREIKICDPAVGSGAFLVGMMNEIVKIRVILDTFLKTKRTIYDFKRHCIQESLYGVDIDAGAIDIAKLRLWLSLVVDEENYLTIQPLPNLDFKIMQGNSLIKEFHGIHLDIEKRKGQLELGSDVSKLDQLIESLHSKNRNFFNAAHPGEKEKMKQEVEKAILEIFHHKLQEKKEFDPETATEIERELHEMTHKNKVRNFFPWKLFFVDVFREKGGFDVIIANPPYVDSEFMVKHLQKEREYISANFDTAQGNWDLYIPFLEHSNNMVNEDGFYTFITPNKWFSINYGLELRKLVKNRLYQICDCNDVKVFEAGNSPVVTFFMMPLENKILKIDYFDENFNYSHRGDIDISILESNNWGVLFSKNISLILKLFNCSNKISDSFSVENPFSVSEAYIVKDILEDLSNIKETGKYFKFVNTGTIDRFFPLWGIKNATYLKNKYIKPIVYKGTLKSILPKRYEQIKSPKIIITGMRYFECFLDSQGVYVAGKSTIIIKKPTKDISLEALTAILNSKLISFYINESYSSLGIDGGINFSKVMVSSLPIPPVRLQEMHSLQLLAQQISLEKSKNPEKDTSVLEAKIDRIVYELRLFNTCN